LKGKVISIDGGRVKVDFNHFLAGKTLEYEIEIVSEIKDQAEKVKSIVYYFTGINKEDLDVKLDENVVEIEFKKHFNIVKEAKSIIARNIIKWVKPIEKVKFVDVFNEQ
jgi:FKBP-type peptidyl-prolyl cis-trans isomerase SlyD